MQTLPITVVITSAQEGLAWKKRVPPGRYPAGQVLFYRGHLSYGVLIVYSGYVDLRWKECDRQTLLRIGPNTIVGLSWFLCEQPVPVTAIVAQDVEASFVDKTLLFSWIKQKEPFAIDLLAKAEDKYAAQSFHALLP